MSGVFCESKAHRHKSTCTWTIHDWEATGAWKPDMKFTSKIFSSATNHETKWCLEIHPMGVTRRELHNDNYFEVNYVSVHLCLVSTNGGSVAQTNFVLYGLNGENAKVTLLTTKVQSTDINSNPRIGMDRAIRRESLSNAREYGVVFDEKLRLVCEVSEWDISNDSLIPKIIVPEYRVDDYSILLETMALSDVKIIAKSNIEFEAHKLILAARSPVFAAMFKHKTREQANNCIEIMDTDPKVIEEMLRFIYTGEVGDIDQMVMDLLVVAEKYDLRRLKSMCEEKLFTTLNIENAANIFMIADDYNCRELKTTTTSFISQHGKDVIQTSGYRSVIKSYPHFAEKFLDELFK